MSANDDTIICRCEEVLQKTIEEAIEEGATSLSDIRRFTRAGMGFCQGRSCQQLVARIISARTGKALGTLVPATCRPPFRPLSLNLLAEEGEEIYKGGDI